MSSNGTHTESHQDLLREQGVSVAAAQLRQLEKASPLIVPAGPMERSLHHPGPFLAWSGRQRSAATVVQSHENVFNHLPLRLGRREQPFLP